MRRLLLLSFIWGWSFLFIKVGVEGLTPSTVAAVRVALGATVLLIFLRVKRISLPTERRMWGHFFVVGLVGSALPFTMLAWGEERITYGRQRGGSSVNARREIARILGRSRDHPAGRVERLRPQRFAARQDTRDSAAKSNEVLPRAVFAHPQLCRCGCGADGIFSQLCALVAAREHDIDRGDPE